MPLENRAAITPRSAKRTLLCFQVIANLRPADLQADEPEETRSRQEAINDLIETMQKARIL